MRKQYHFKKSQNGFFAWDVDKLVRQTSNFEIIDVPLSEISEFEQPYWYLDTSDVPTCRSIADHMKLVQKCELRFPIILAADGSVMDGMHRVCKAYLNGQTTLKAVKFKTTPKPDFENVQPDELTYDR